MVKTDAERQAEYYHSHSDEINKARRAKYMKTKKAGMCVICRKKKAAKGMTKCLRCRDRFNARRRT